MNFKNSFLFIFLLLLLGACSVEKLVPDGSYLLDRVVVSTDNKEVQPGRFNGYLKQTPNARWFSRFRVPLRIYVLAGKDSTNRMGKLLRKMGEAPVLYDEALTERTRKDIQQALVIQGYLRAQVAVEKKEEKHRKLTVNYRLHPGIPYTLHSVKEEIADARIAEILQADSAQSRLKVGDRFSANVLDEERSRINALLQDLGYYQFNKEYITFQADTVENTFQVDLTLKLRNPQNSSSHTSYRIGSVGLQMAQRSAIRSRVLSDNILIEPDSLYSLSRVQTTYQNLNRLKALKFANITLQVSPLDSTRLNCLILTELNRPRSLTAELEGTNSAGDLGAAASLTYSHRNLFRGSEMLTVKLRGAYENITGLEGYSNQNYMEWGLETALNFPRFLFPFLSRNLRRSLQASSEISLQYNLQNRPEFRRRVASAAWRYRWQKDSRKISHKFDVLDVSYIYMPWISPTFKEEYLDNLNSYNAILKYNYEDIFIMKMGYSFTYNSMGLTGGTGSNSGTNSYTIRANIETAGNVLQGVNKLLGGTKNDEGQYTLFNIAFAQYVKGDFDLSKCVKFDDRNSMALHVGLGVAYPYGNASMLPFEKRYFSGGANSVRGWNVRTLGPGSYRGVDRAIDYINQSGDIKLDLNMEYRTHLFWKVDGALFVDAGNIWTIRNYKDQPGGQFRINEFYKQLAASYGLGFRLVFDYFILRFDGGMKAVNPAYLTRKEHYPLIHPSFGRDFTFHFAVGLPF